MCKIAVPKAAERLTQAVRCSLGLVTRNSGESTCNGDPGKAGDRLQRGGEGIRGDNQKRRMHRILILTKRREEQQGIANM